MKTTTHQDEKVQRNAKKLVQQRMSATLSTLFFQPEKSYRTPNNATEAFEVGTVARIPEPVNDVDKLKQRLIEVLAGCMQQTVVDEATGERKRTSWVCSRVK